jgi:hypothetical protein
MYLPGPPDAVVVLGFPIPLYVAAVVAPFTGMGVQLVQLCAEAVREIPSRMTRAIESRAQSLNRITEKVLLSQLT